MNAHRFLVTLAGILLLALAGCGLKEYEERMDLERKRAKAFDQKENLLDDLLEAPAIQNVSVWETPVFLRVPRGCRSTAAKISYPGSNPRYEMDLYRFPFNQDKPDLEKAGWNLFVGRSSSVIASSQVISDLVASALKEYFSKDKISFVPPRTLVDYTLDAEADKKLEFGKMEFETSNELSVVQVYIFQHGKRHLALAFQTPKGVASTTGGMVDACLKTIDISDEAVEKTGRFMSTRRAKK